MARNSKYNVDINADTSNFAKGVDGINRMTEELDSSLTRIKQKTQGPFFNNKALSSVNDLQRSLKGIVDMLDKANSKKGNSGNPFQKALYDDSKRQAQQISKALNAQQQAILNSSKIIKSPTLSRGRQRLNQDFDTLRSEYKQNNGSKYQNASARETNSEARNMMAQANRLINAVHNNDGRISARDKRSYNSRLDSIGSYLGVRADGTSDKMESLKEQREDLFKRGDAAVSERDRLAVKTNRTDDENAKLAELEKDITEALKSVDAIDSSIKVIGKLEDKFKELQSTGNDIRSVTPSRRSAYVTYSAIGAARNMFSSGESIINSQQQDTRSLTAAAGTYNSFSMRHQAERAGMRYGISGSEMLAAENSYVQGAGYTSDDDVNRAGVRTGILAKVTGATVADSTSLTSTYAQNVQGANATSLAGFQQTFEGALDKSGMTKYGASQVKALDKLLSTVAKQNGGSLTKEQANSLANVQGQLASTGNKALMGENGADTMSTVSSAIQGSSTNPTLRTAFLLSDRQRYSGVTGQANLIRDTSEGLSNEHVQDMLKQIGQGKGLAASFGSTKLASTFMSQQLGVQPKVMDDIIKGLNTGDNTALNKAIGKSSEKSKLSTQQSSGSEASVDRNNASQEAANAQLGQLTLGLKAATGSVIASSVGLTQFNTMLRMVTATMEGAAPVMAGKTAASVLSGGAKLNSKYATNANLGATGTSTPTSWNEAAAAKINSGGGKFGNWARNTKVGGGLSSLASTALMSTPVTKATALGTKATSLVANSSKLQAISNVATKGTNLVAGTLGRVAPFIPAAVEGVSAVSDKANRGSHIGGAIGSTIGTVAGLMTGNPLLAMAASMGGQAIGSGIGGLFDKRSSSNSTKDEQSLTNKKSAVEKLREKNIKADSSLTDKQLRAEGKKSGSGSGTRSSTTGTSPYDKALNETNKTDSAKAKSSNIGHGSANKVVVSGTINHTGNVADTSQLKANTQSAINNLLTNPEANETN